MFKQEVERKFLLFTLPKLKYDTVFIINQYYTKDKIRYREEIHSSKKEYIQNFKSPAVQITNFESRTEYETQISKDDYMKNYENCVGKILSKKRYEISSTNFTWMIDVFLNGTLIIAELELHNGFNYEPVNDPLYSTINQHILLADPPITNFNLSQLT